MLARYLYKELMDDLEKYINLLSWDSGFFGYKVGEVKNSPQASFLNEILDFCRQTGFRLIYLRAEDSNPHIKEFIFKNNGTLADQKITYRMPITLHYKNISANISISNPGIVSPDLLKIALQTGEFSRYNTDKKFGRDKFEDLYSTWIEKSIRKEIADEVVFYIENGIIKGYCTLTFIQNIGHISLFGVDSDHRRKGIGKELLKQTVNLCIDRKCEILEVATQLGNEPACKFYENFGFQVYKKELIYHFWL